MTLQAHKIFFRDAIQEAFRTGGKKCLADAKRHFSARNRDMVTEYKSTQPNSPSRHNYAESIRSIYRLGLLSAAKKAEVYSYI